MLGRIHYLHHLNHTMLTNSHVDASLLYMCQSDSAASHLEMLEYIAGMRGSSSTYRKSRLLTSLDTGILPRHLLTFEDSPRKSGVTVPGRFTDDKNHESRR